MDENLLETTIAVLIVVIIILGIIGFAKGWWFPEKEQRDEKRYDIEIRGSPYLGDDSAKVLFVIFEDFDCSVCKKYTKEAEPILIKDFVETGKIKYVFKHFPMISIHPKSYYAAIASECADEQNRFWEYHNVLFNISKELEIGLLQQVAKDVLENYSLFNECFLSERYKDVVMRDYLEGINKEVSGSPTFFINGRKIVGYRDYEELKRIIQEEIDLTQKS